MPLVDRHIHRLADRAAGMVQSGRGLRQFDEIAKVLNRAVAAALVEIHDEGRAIGRGEDHGLAADLDGLGRVARVLGEGARGGFQKLLQHALFELDQHAVDLRPGALPMIERDRIVAELDADFGEDAVGCGFDLQQALFAEHIIGRNIAHDIGRIVPHRPARPLVAPRLAAGALAVGGGRSAL